MEIFVIVMVVVIVTALAFDFTNGFHDPANAVTTTIAPIFAGLAGAILWNLLAPLRGLPSSSSHALISGLVGATLVASGVDAVNFVGIVGKVVLPAVSSPVIAAVIALVATHLAYRITARSAVATITRVFRSVRSSLRDGRGHRERLRDDDRERDRHWPHPQLHGGGLGPAALSRRRRECSVRPPGSGACPARPGPTARAG